MFKTMIKKCVVLVVLNCVGLIGMAQLQLPTSIPKPSGLFMTELLGRSLILEPVKRLITTDILRQLIPFLQSQDQAECLICNQRASTSILTDGCTSHPEHLFHRGCLRNRENMECPACNSHISLQVPHVREIRRCRNLRAQNPHAVAINSMRCFHCNLPAQPHRPIISVCKDDDSEAICLAHGAHPNCFRAARQRVLQRAQENDYFWLIENGRLACPHRHCLNRVLDPDNDPRVVLDEILGQAPEANNHQGEAHQGEAQEAALCPICRDPAQPGNPIISVCRDEFGNPQRQHGYHRECIDQHIAHAGYRGPRCALCRGEVDVDPNIIVEEYREQPPQANDNDGQAQAAPHEPANPQPADPQDGLADARMEQPIQPNIPVGPIVQDAQAPEHNPVDHHHNNQGEVDNPVICPICREAAGPDNPIISVCRDPYGNPQRQHGLHQECIDRHIAHAGYRGPRCPLCRGRVDVDPHIIVAEYEEPVMLHNQDYVPQCDIEECDQCPECPVCNDGPQAGNPIISICLDANEEAEQQHGCHESCIRDWANSGRPNAGLCPLCGPGFPIYINPDVIIEHQEEPPDSDSSDEEPEPAPAPAPAQEHHEAEEQANQAVPAVHECFGCHNNHIQREEGIEVLCTNANEAHTYVLAPRCVVDFLRNPATQHCSAASCDAELEISCPVCDVFQELTNFSIFCTSNEHYICNDCLVEYIQRQNQPFVRQCEDFERVHRSALNVARDQEEQGNEERARNSRRSAELVSRALEAYRREYQIRCWEADCNMALARNYPNIECAACQRSVPEELARDNRCPACV